MSSFVVGLLLFCDMTKYEFLIINNFIWPNPSGFTLPPFPPGEQTELVGYISVSKAFENFWLLAAAIVSIKEASGWWWCMPLHASPHYRGAVCLTLETRGRKQREDWISLHHAVILLKFWLYCFCSRWNHKPHISQLSLEEVRFDDLISKTFILEQVMARETIWRLTVTAQNGSSESL